MSEFNNEKDLAKRNHAIALHYGLEDDAPRILACGPGEIAKKILEIAKENKIPIKQDDGLVQILSSLDAGSNVPPECYRAIAEILAFLFRTDIAWKERKIKEFPTFNENHKNP